MSMVSMYVKKFLAFLKRHKFGHPRNVYQALKPVYLTSRIFGLSPFKCDLGIGYVYSKINVAYSFSFVSFFSGNLQFYFFAIFFLIFWMFSVYYLITLHDRSVVGFKENSKISSAIDFFQMYSGFVVMIVAVVMIHYQRNLFFESLQELVLIDSDLKMFFSHQKYNKTRNVVFGK